MSVPPTTALRPGQVIYAWRTVLAVGWVALVVCLFIVAGAGEVSGRPVWWFGHESDRQMLPVMLVPFVLPLAVIAMAWRGTRFVVAVSLAATLVLAVTAWLDRDDAPGAAAMTALITVAALALSLAAFAGRARRIR